MTCEEATNAAWAALDGALDETEAGTLERHLAGCAACRGEALATARVAAAFVASPAPPAPAELMARLGLADIKPVPAKVVLAAAPVALPRKPTPKQRPAWLQAWLPIASGLAAAAVIAGVGFVGRPTVPVPTAVALVSPSPASAEEATADGDAILVWFGPEADPVEPW